MSFVLSSVQDSEVGVGKQSVPMRLEDLIKAYATSTPEALAVIEAAPGGQRGKTLTYRDLEGRSTEVARHLADLGTVPGSIVAFCMSRSVEAVVAILGIIKAGAMYLPLDPDYLWPDGQLRELLDVAGVQLLMVHSATSQQMHALSLSQTILNVEDAKALHALREETLPLHQDRGAAFISPSAVGPETISPDPLCIMYTSGSTGTPKGVMITHRGVGRLVIRANYIALSPGMRVASTSSLAFDASLFEVFGALHNGSTIVVIPRAQVLLPHAAADLFRLWSIDVAFLTTSIFHRYAAVVPGAFGQMHCLLFGGEIADPAAVVRVLQSPTPPQRLLNMYGPSENTTFSTFYEVPRSGALPLGQALPVGKPVSGTEVYVLDEHQQLVPDGEEGEVYVGGHGLALGYIHRLDLTERAFIHHSDLGRLYRTGDRGRWRSDGGLEFCGRQDGQVKLHGFRVESEALAFTLCSHPLVREAAVVLVREPQRPPSLVAYLVLSSPCEDESVLLRELQDLMHNSFLAQQVPTSYFLIPSLPLTASGKIDGKLLSEPARVTGMRQLYPGEVRRQEISQQEAHIRQLSSTVLELAPEQIDVERPLREYGMDSLRLSIYAATLEEAFPGSSQNVLRAVLAGASVRRLAATLKHTRKRPNPLLVAKDPSVPFLAADPWVTQTSRSLLHGLLTGDVASLDGAAITYLPPLSPAQEVVMKQLHQGHVVITSIVTTRLGRTGVFLLPVQATRLYTHQEEVLAQAVEAVGLAQACGARAVSLTGLLASATAYGRTLQQALAQRSSVTIPVTTGHATVGAAVVRNLEWALDAAGRDLRMETLAVVGLGSIGVSTLRLALSVLPHPRELLLCDLVQQRGRLEALRAELQEHYQLGEACRIVESRGQWVSPELYEATLFLGASNGGECLDVSALRPGSIVIDDSAPHCFSLARARERMESQGDLLFAEGGELESDFHQEELRFCPEGSEQEREVYASILRSEEVRGLRDGAAGHVMSCLLASSLVSGLKLSPTLGLVDRETMYQHYQALRDLGVRGTPPFLGGQVCSPEYLEAFRSRYRTRIARV